MEVFGPLPWLLLSDISMVFEVLGCNLLKLIIASDYKGLPVRTVKWITKQVQYIMSRECLSRVYMCGWLCTYLGISYVSIRMSICMYVCTNVCTNVCRGRGIVTHYIYIYMRAANGHTLDVYNYIVQRLKWWLCLPEYVCTLCTNPRCVLECTLRKHGSLQCLSFVHLASVVISV